ncbi:MATE family efflux transporter [Cognatishimia sp. MH4019]|uniref:MATE family efflux transporter n=1 Tax=Cognatishimia sp. MH4019 TaxID=2854030 RepID=UPI001CD1E501|nr:MATE family efflux transporter [Cognatishimia sp. MH4019]
MSAPMSLGIFGVLSVGIADAYFLGQLGGTPLAAVGFIYPVTAAITSLSIGLSAGANSAISQAIGGGQDETTTGRLALHAFALGGALALLVGLAFWLFSPLLFSLMGASDAVLKEIADYAPFWALSFPFLVLMMITNAVFRAHGDSITAALTMLGVAIINIALDPLFIFGWGPVPAMETGGAALATFIARAAGAGFIIYWAHRKGLLCIGKSPTKGALSSVKTIGDVGLPAAFSNAINPAGMAAVTAAVATLGDAAVAGFGAATRVQSVALVVLLALSAGIGPVVGQNWGAEKYNRARAALFSAWGICLTYGLAAATLLFFFAEPIAGLIAPAEEERAFTAQYLRIVSWSLFGYGVVVTINAAMNARSKALYSMSLSIGRVFAIYLPGAWLGVWLFGYTGVLAAAIAANLLSVVAAIWMAKRTGLISTKRVPLQEAFSG